MLILGLTKTTLLDYPQKVAATIFTGGCNFRCPFCHNGQLVLNAATEESISEAEVFEHLTKRRNVLEGVCITGGEPTIQADLPDFIKKIKELGYCVKLDTNGGNPGMLKRLVQEGLVDYVAMDIKNSKEKYKDTAIISENLLEKVKESVDYLLKGEVAYEFRTTVVRQLHTEKDLLAIAEWIKGCSHWYIQSYKDNENVINRDFSAYSKDELCEMLSKAEGIEFSLRGIE